MPCELSTPEGKIVWQACYKAWGNRCSSEISVPTKGSEAEQPLRFQGQYYDEENGLHYNRYRYYDPCTGRFITPDPIGLAGGENVYRYAPNPTVWRDPLGLMSPPPVLGGSGGSLGFSSGNIGQASYEFDHVTRNLSITSHGVPFIMQTDRLASGSTLAKQVKDVAAREGFQVNRVQLQSCYSGVGGVHRWHSSWRIVCISLLPVTRLDSHHLKIRQWAPQGEIPERLLHLDQTLGEASAPQLTGQEALLLRESSRL